jgi:multiple sugar transport system substrate-binding protein
MTFQELSTRIQYEFMSAAKKLTKDTDGDGQPDQWGLAVEGASITENSHWAFILGRQQGGTLFKGNKPNFDSPEIVRAVKQYVDFIGEDGIAAPRMAEFSDGTQSPTAFAKREAAMLVYQKNAETNIKSAGMKEDEYGVAEVPVPDQLPSGGAEVMSHVAGINIAVFENSANKEAALKFVKFMTSKDEQVKLNQEFDSLPVTKEAAEAKEFSGERVSTFQNILANHAEPMPLIPEEGKMETVIGSAIKQLFAKAATSGSVSEADVKKQLSAAQEKMEAG